MNQQICNNHRKKYIECERCKRQIPWKRTRRCNRCRNLIIEEYRNNRNQNEGDNEIEILRQEVGLINTLPANDINKRNNQIKHQGYIDSTKQQECIRILSLNPRGFGPENEEKLAMMIKSIKKYSIDAVLLSSPDRKWTNNKLERLQRRFRQVNKEVEIISSNSDQNPRTSNGYLPGGTASILLGRIAGMKVKDSERRDSLGRWNSFDIEGNNKTIRICNIYRIIDSSSPGILKSKVQYDRSTGEVKIQKNTENNY